MPGPSRREICAGSALAAIAWGVAGCEHDPGVSDAPGKSFPVSPEAIASPEWALALADFLPLVGTSFDIEEANAASQPLVLMLAQPFGRSSRSSFVLVFMRASRTPLEQDTYAVRHPALGRFSLFLVPHDDTTMKQGPRRHAALFSRG